MNSNESSSPPELTTIHVAHGLLHAHVIRAKLEEAGIPVLLSYQSMGPILGVSTQTMGEVQIQVPEEQAEAARRLIATGGSETGAEEDADS